MNIIEFRREVNRVAKIESPSEKLSAIMDLYDKVYTAGYNAGIQDERDYQELDA